MALEVNCSIYTVQWLGVYSWGLFRHFQRQPTDTTAADPVTIASIGGNAVTSSSHSPALVLGPRAVAHMLALGRISMPASGNSASALLPRPHISPWLSCDSIPASEWTCHPSLPGRALNPLRHDDRPPTDICPISPSEYLRSFGQQNANRFNQESWIYREQYNLTPAELQSGRTETWECLAPFCDLGLQNEANKEGRAEKETDQVLMSFKASDQALLDSSGLLSYLSPYILFPLASLSKVFFFFFLITCTQKGLSKLAA